jgi:Concanavalin A-like lectin/glucanases superfamily
MRPYHSGMVRGFLLAVVGCFGLAACSGGGGSSQSAQVLNLGGFWQTSTVSALGYDSFLLGNLTQTGNEISGTLTIFGSPCASSGTLTGNISGSTVTMSLTEGLQSVSLTGTATSDGNSITGSYQTPSGGCTNGDSGTFTATRTSANTGCTPVPPGIVSWWKGEGNALDQEGANPGTVEGGVTFLLGKVGQAFYLDGSTGYVDVPNSSSLQSISTTVTVEMWVQPTVPSTGGYLYARRDPITSENFSVYVQNDGTLTVLLRTTTSPTETGSKFSSAPGAVALFGQTQHIVATANLSTSSVNAYVNGVAVPLTVVYGPATLGGTFAPVTHLYLGRREDPGLEGQAGAAYFPGMLDEVSLYSTALTQSQIEAIVSAGSAGKCQ